MRPTKVEWFLEQAQVVAKRSTCLRRAVGCILVDARGQQLSTGYNGVARGLPHCNERGPDELTGRCPNCGGDGVGAWTTRGGQLVGLSCGNHHPAPEPTYPHACAGAHAASGTELDACEAIHAEQNALLQCPDVWAISQAFVTVSPCLTCVKLFLNTGCQQIVFAAPYAHDAEARRRWEQAGRFWTHAAVTAA